MPAHRPNPIPGPQQAQKRLRRWRFIAIGSFALFCLGVMLAFGSYSSSNLWFTVGVLFFVLGGGGLLVSGLRYGLLKSR
jgi:hypothetical protein